LSLAGLIVVAGTLLSVIGTLVVPRAVASRITRVCDRVVDFLVLHATAGVGSYVRRDRILAWQSPLSLIVRLSVWLTLLVVGFSLVLLPAVGGPLAASIHEAGSSILTLGYAAPRNAGSTVVEYAAAFTGLVVIGLQVGYLPTLYAAFNRRETEVTLLTSRAGLPAWGPEILARTLWGISEGDTGPVLGDLFRSWERWSAELAESHTTYVVLVRLRSPRPLSHWLTALLAVMDAAALHLAVAPAREPKLPARLLLRMGFTALEQIARAVGIAVPQEADPDAPISISYEQFHDAVEELRRLGYPVERTSEQAWPHFRGWRANYDIAALGLARELDAPPAMWSGPRRWPSQPLASARPALRMAREAAQGSQTQPKSPGS
jgi:putative Mn2+ efflux pump MntP